MPLLAQVVAVVDVYDALTSARSYRPALSAEDSTRHLLEEARRGRFAMAHVEAFLDTVAAVAV